jgi:hypothetical protein
LRVSLLNKPARRNLAIAREPDMKHFMIKYRFTEGTQADWHQEMARFIAALENDPALKGKIAYRCMKSAKSSDYYHLAATSDDQATAHLQKQGFFKHYTEATRRVAGGEVEVLPLEIIAETKHRA